MPRTQFENDLENLQDELLLMGSMVTQALHDSVEALKRRDMQEAQRLIADDRMINRKRFAIEDGCLTLIATQQPMARDMRLIAAILEIAGELERIGDYAKGIGRIIVYMKGEPAVKPLIHIPRMCDLVTDMLKRALGAFIERDVETARELPKEDDQLDDLYNQINRDLIAIIMARPEQTEHANYLLWAGHNLERAGDRITNICERIVYTVTGEYTEMDTLEFGLAGLN